ncbi:MAG: hypothetical protein EOO29_20245 [Comamonadaceae bacterium]|nr:MAG: hypothetical protein EOO29_20245 [Comamonadaceae bacterium]
MSDIADGLNSHQKLAASRKRLLDAMGYVPMTSNVSGELMLGKDASAQSPRRSFSLSLLPAQLRESTAVQWAQRWWQDHPVHDIADLGRPYLKDYAQQHPAKLVACAAGVGAALWLMKPWRLVSTAAILSLAIKAGARGMLKASITRRLS